MLKNKCIYFIIRQTKKLKKNRFNFFNQVMLQSNEIFLFALLNIKLPAKRKKKHPNNLKEHTSKDI